MTAGYRVTILTGEPGTLDLEKLYVGLLDQETLRTHSRDLRSVLGKVAWRLAESQPCGPWYWQGKAAIVSTLPIERTEVTFRHGDAEESATVEPVPLVHRPNLWDLADRSALAAILSSALRREIEGHSAIEYRFGRGEGMLTLSDPAILTPYCPTWYTRSKPEELAALWRVPHVPKLKKSGIPMFQPYRYIDLQPGVGLGGQPLLRFGFSTRMESNPDFTLSKTLSMRGDWSNVYDNPRFLFRIVPPASGQKSRIRIDSGTWIVRSISSRTMQDSLHDGKSAIQEFGSWLEAYGMVLSRGQEDLIANDVAVTAVRNVWEDEPETLVLPARCLSPIVDFGNAWFYRQFTDANLEEAYAGLTHIITPAKAAMLETIAAYLSDTLRTQIQTTEGTRSVRFRMWQTHEESNRGKRGTSREARRMRLVGEPVLFKLPAPYALLRHNGVFAPIDLLELALPEGEQPSPGVKKWTGIMAYVQQGGYQVYRAAPQMASGIRLAVVAPAQKTSGERPVVADMLPATFRFDADGILPASQRLGPRAGGKVHPLKNLKTRLEELRNFFEASPMQAFFQPVNGDRGDPAAFEDAMGQALNAGADAFLVILPRGIPKWKQDRIYFSTHRFGFAESKPVLHFVEGSWKKDTTFYSMVFVTLAKLNTRFGGLNFKVDLGKTVPLLADYPNVLIVAYDFGRSQKDYLGVITATDSATQEMVVRRTPEIGSVKEAMGSLEELLGNLVREYDPDLLVVLRDSKFSSMEARGLGLNYQRLGVTTLPIETLKNGGISGYHLTPRGRGKGLNVGSPYGYALYSPDMNVNVFSSAVEIHQGIWAAIRFAVNPQPFPLELDFDFEDVANLGFGLSKMGGYFSDPAKTKYPDILARADKLVELYKGGALAGISREVDAREFDPS